MADDNANVTLTQPVGDDDHVLGPENANATLVQYGDYECDYCRQLHPEIREVLHRTDGLRFVYRHFPNTRVHPNAARAAEAAEAAAAQGRFWEMHDVLFEQVHPLEDKLLSHCAHKAGLDMTRYTQEMSDRVYAAKVENDFMSAVFTNHVTGTPTLYLNRVLLSDARDVKTLLEVVTKAGATLRANVDKLDSWLSRLRKFRRH